MSTFSQENTGGKNARAAQSAAPKDDATKDDIRQADETVAKGEGDEGQTQIDQAHPNEPTEVAKESADETADRHVASTELPVEKVTAPETQDDSPLAEQTEDAIVPGAATGPDRAGVVRNDEGKVAHAPAGSLNAAFAGVQEDASGFVDSVGTDNSPKSGTRI